MSENSNDNERRTSDANYSNITFEDIKKRLVEKARAYYPDTYRDFNKTSFGSMMLDMVALVGEQLNFYAQFVANEAYLQTTRTSEGYYLAARKVQADIGPSATYGNIKWFASLQADETQSRPLKDSGFHVLAGAVCENSAGMKVTTLEDAYFSPEDPTAIGTSFNQGGNNITQYTVSKEVACVSGEVRTMLFKVGSYQKFLSIRIQDTDVTDVLSIFDDKGNEYFKVKDLSQDFVFSELIDRTKNPDSTPRLIRKHVPRRFRFERESDDTAYVSFGYGSEDSLQKRQVATSAKIAMEQYGREINSDTIFDPNNLLKTNRFGVAPQNTTLTIRYRVNTTENSNAAANSINKVISAEIVYDDPNLLTNEQKDIIKNSLQCLNKEPLNGSVTYSSTQEISEMITAMAGAQGRAVTPGDYIAQSLLMPNKFGKIKKCALWRDNNDLKRNLNLYCIAEDSSGNLQTPSSIIKQNLKTWLNSSRMISDTIDIYDALILNVGLVLDLALNGTRNKTTAMSEIRTELYNQMTLTTPEIGQSFSIGEVERILNSMPLVNRVNKIQVIVKSGTGYSETRHDVPSNLSPDGGLVYIPENFIWEIKNKEDITGKVK